MIMKRWKNTIVRILALMLLLSQGMLPAAAEPGEDAPMYTLERVVILSRHNIRSPLSGSGSLLGDITPHEWFDWTSPSSELSLRGGIAETMMGQYFRLLLEKEGLFPEHYQPLDGEVRFDANALQRTQATARYFAAGLLPLADVPVEMNVPFNTMDPVFHTRLTFLTDAYAADVRSQVAEKGGIAGMKGIQAGLADAMELLMDVADVEESEAYQTGTFGDLLSDESVIHLELGKEPTMTGPIKTATSLADAMTMQLYEETDAEKAAFGHSLSEADWQKLHTIVDTYTDMLFLAPLVSVHVAHPMLEEIRNEMTAPGRKFSFLCGHDANIASVLAALNVEDYLLPDTVEQHTPIGSKLVFARWLDAEGNAYWTVRLIYQSTEKLRSGTAPTLADPPVAFPLRFENLTADEDGMIPEKDFMERLEQSIAAYDALAEQYGVEEADDAA